MFAAVVPYALSVHSFVDKVGSYAGFAAIIGVALLVLMFFVNARETSALRERAEDAEDRLERLEYQVDQAGSRATAQPSVQPAVAAPPPVVPAPDRVVPGRAGAVAATQGGSVRVVGPVPATARGATATASVIPAAPVGVGAPALSSATRLIPIADPAAIAAPAAANGVAQPPPAAPPPTAAPPPPTPPPSTAAAGSSAPGTSAPGPSAPPSAAAPPAFGPPPPLHTAPRRDYGRSADGGPRTGRVLLGVAGVVVLAIVVVAVVVLVLHGSHGGSRNAASTRLHGRAPVASTSRHRTTVQVKPAHVTVAVLNGTSTYHLAGDVSAKLTAAGFHYGGTGNYPDQTQTATIVGYLPGDRVEALAVAKSLHVGATAVQAVGTAARQVACSSTPTSCPDQVVVTVGSNLASAASVSAAS